MNFWRSRATRACVSDEEMESLSLLKVNKHGDQNQMHWQY
jgi:hypothetical protein